VRTISRLFVSTCVLLAFLVPPLVAQTSPVRIGFSMDTLEEERWRRDKSLVEQRAKEVGAIVEVQVANGDDALQKKQALAMLAGGVDVLLIVPHNAGISASIVEAAKKSGVPVIAYDRMIRNADVDLYISHTPELIGELQAEYALQRVPKGNYVLIGGDSRDVNTLMLRKGQMRVLDPAIKRGDIKVISAEFASEWSPKDAERIVRDALGRSASGIDAIVASNDGTAAGAIAALGAAKLAGKVLVTGQDAEKDAMQRIVAGTQSMTIYKSLKELADAAVDAAVKLARKQPVAGNQTVNNGKKDVNAILLKPMVVDKSNIEETVIRDGFHQRADIYRQ
jgi:D-xylose transport system substrate-binding protein